MKPWIWLLVVAIAVVVAAWLTLRKGSSGRAEDLVRRYRKLSGLSQVEAADALDRHVERLRARSPGKPLEWYLGEALKELESDKRRS